ncbi:MAG: hypothetical protein KAI53_03700 [Candidatus Aenigmarchaeota archaeon]|nr:hypothetical protein [Candidatus Aenigmarchaeota archaeon]
MGAFVICILLATVTVGKNSINLYYPEDTTKNMFSNILSESKSTINIIAKENLTSKNMENRLLEYMTFISRVGEEHKINLSGYFLVAMPTGNNLNVTLVNFNKKPMTDIKIYVNASEKTISSLTHNNATTITFTDVSDYLKFNYTYSEYNGTAAETLSEEINTTKRIFSYIKLRFLSGEDIKQSVSFN